MYFLIAAGAVVLLNIISSRVFFRLDFTADKAYTLSPATKAILGQLKEPVTVKAYFSGNLPPELQKSQRDFQEMLVEYSALAGGNLKYEFIDPSENEQTQREAQSAGVPPIQVQVRKDDRFEATTCFLGATVESGTQPKEVLPTIQEGMPIEYMLSSAVKKLSVTEKPLVGFVQGTGQPSLGAMQQAMAQLSVLYRVEPVILADSANDLSRYRTVVMLGAKDSISPSQLVQLDALLSRGNGLLVAIDRVAGDFQTAQGSVQNTGLETWLANKGIKVDPSFALDVNCASVGVVRQVGGMNIQQSVQFPYMPIIRNFNTHPASKGLEQVILQFASPISFTGDSTITYTELAKTSERSAVMPAPLAFEAGRAWQESDFPEKNITVAAALEGPIAGTAQSKMVVISDAEFAAGGEGYQARQINPDNISLLVNAIDWLSDETGLIDLRTKSIESRPIDTLEDGTRATLKYLNFLLPLAAAGIYGLLRMQMRRNQRLRRMVPGML